jgi:hypothetical protein
MRVSAEAYWGPIIDAGALPLLVSILASSASEATKEQCVFAIRNISTSGAFVARLELCATLYFLRGSVHTQCWHRTRNCI